MNQNIKQNKREQNHKVEFLTTKKIEGEKGTNHHYFSMAFEQKETIKAINY